MRVDGYPLHPDMGYVQTYLLGSVRIWSRELRRDYRLVAVVSVPKNEGLDFRPK